MGRRSHPRCATEARYPREQAHDPALPAAGAALPPNRAILGDLPAQPCPDIWARDFLPVTDPPLRPLYAFFIVALGTRRVVHVGVARHPTDAWVARQLREATPCDERPRFLIRDNHGKYGPRFDRLAAASGSRVLRTPIRAPRADATCERFLGSVRRACLDHLLVLGEAHLRRVLRAYVAYFNRARPHQGIDQAVPAGSPAADRQGASAGRVVAFPIVGGLHHDYRRVA